MWMVGEDGKIAGMTVVDMGGWRLQLGFAMGCEIQLVAWKFGADEVAGCEYFCASRSLIPPGRQRARLQN